jgi:hypothetical protein
MGSKESKLKERLLYDIVANREGDLKNLLEVTYTNTHIYCYLGT